MLKYTSMPMCFCLRSREPWGQLDGSLLTCLPLVCAALHRSVSPDFYFAAQFESDNPSIDHTEYSRCFSLNACLNPLHTTKRQGEEMHNAEA